MRKIIFLLFCLLFSACVTDSKYAVEKSADKFNNNEITVSMKGGAIDADPLGIVKGAEFSPVVVRDQGGKIKALAIYFNYERNTTYTGEDYLNIGFGSSALFLIDGSEKIELQAGTGDIFFDIDRPLNKTYVEKQDSGIFAITPDQLKKIAYAKDIAVRVSGVSSFKDFPRTPNFHLLKTFLPNIRAFYENEVAPYEAL